MVSDVANKDSFIVSSDFGERMMASMIVSRRGQCGKHPTRTRSRQAHLSQCLSFSTIFHIKIRVCCLQNWVSWEVLHLQGITSTPSYKRTRQCPNFPLWERIISGQELSSLSIGLPGNLLFYDWHVLDAQTLQSTRLLGCKPSLRGNQVHQTARHQSLKQFPELWLLRRCPRLSCRVELGKKLVGKKLKRVHIGLDVFLFFLLAHKAATGKNASAKQPVRIFQMVLRGSCRCPN